MYFILLELRHSLGFVCKWPWMYEICPITSCRLLAYFALSCMSLWPSVLSSCLLYVRLCISVYESLFCFWVSLTPSVPFYLFFCIFLFLCLPGHLTLSEALSRCLCNCFWWHVFLFLHISLCVSPSLFLFVPLGMACVCVFLACSHHVGTTKWVSQCVRSSLYVSLLSMPVGHEADEKLPRYIPSLKSSLSVKRLKEVI